MASSSEKELDASNVPSGSEQPVPSPQKSVTHLIVKWSGTEYDIKDVEKLKTVRDLKLAIQEKTRVQVDRQKLLNLTLEGKLAQDDCNLDSLSLKSGQKLMMMGSLERDLENIDIPPEDRQYVTNDLDVPDDVNLPVHDNEVYIKKVDQRVEEYEVTVLNPSRPNKKLLVLDIDYSIYDHKSPNETVATVTRPFLHQFLTAAYLNYDLAIWSATSMRWIVEKTRLLGMSDNPDYKFTLYIDYLAMITVNAEPYGVVETKPLRIIWDKFPQYTPKNTIMIDDMRRNFLMNPQSGLRIKTFKSAAKIRVSDCELLKIGEYLKKIALLDDFTTLNHQNWAGYGGKVRKPKKSSSNSPVKKPPGPPPPPGPDPKKDFKDLKKF